MKANIRQLIKFLPIFILLIILCIGTILFIFKRNENRIINIVFNTDKNYTEYTKVAILSALDSKNKNSVYNIHILCVDIPQSKEKEFKLLANDFENVNVKTIPLNLSKLKGIGEYDVENPITRTDLFKFFMPDIFQDLDKILYIDGDTLILKDLSKLYNTDISDKYLGAVKGPYFHQKMMEDKNGLYSFEKYYTYNCGVILFNLKKLREDNIKEKLIKQKSEDNNKEFVTQTAYNEVIPLNEIKQLSPIYNFYGSYDKRDFRIYNVKKAYLPYTLFVFSLKQFSKKAVIVHYWGQNKPWSENNVLFADKWWYYAKRINPNWKLEKKRNNK